jgi:hypothetical protein
MTEWDTPKVDLGHPDSAIRLASAVHRFCVPKMNVERNISFARSFNTTGKHDKTRKLMLNADDARKKLMEALSVGKVSHERIVADARRYQPFINQILISCKVQPEMAMLDGKCKSFPYFFYFVFVFEYKLSLIGFSFWGKERLIFDWLSGLESTSTKTFKSEAMMYDLVMCVVCEGLGKAGVATETSLSGEFAAASR